MWSAEEVTAELGRRGDLWESIPGLTGMRGELRALYESIDRRIGEIGQAAAGDEWHVPPALSFGTLNRARYFESFPHWLTAVSHLPDSPTLLAEISVAADPGRSASRSLEPAAAVLTPAVCYHVYEQLTDRTVDAPHLVGLRGTCWRHEKGRVRSLERGWSFTMREIVCVGTEADVRSFLDSAVTWAAGFATSLGLMPELAAATDPFFAASGRGRELLQRIKGLKSELLTPIGDSRRLAVSSFNNHETFFGDAFQIRLPDGGPAHSACVAFGLERWVLAILCAHGPNPEEWPTIGQTVHHARGGGR